MAVQKSRKSRSRRNMRSAHVVENLKTPTLSVNTHTGLTHLRHNIDSQGFYKGKRILIKSK